MRTLEHQLATEQIVSYHVQGFLTLERVMSAGEIEDMKVIYDGLFAREAGRDSGDHFDLGGSDEEGAAPKLPQILDVSRYAPEIKEFDFCRATEDLARQLLGKECVIRGEHAINKPAQTGVETPWHQDEACWDPSLLYESLSIWIPLQDVSTANGCMQFLPGAHRLGVLEHQSIGGDPRVHGLEVHEAGLDLSGAVASPLPAGGATIHGNRMLHYTGPNRSDQPRRALIVMAQLPPRPYPFDRRFPWNERKLTARERRGRAAAETAGANG